MSTKLAKLCTHCNVSQVHWCMCVIGSWGSLACVTAALLLLASRHRVSPPALYLQRPARWRPTARSRMDVGGFPDRPSIIAEGEYRVVWSSSWWVLDRPLAFYLPPAIAMLLPSDAEVEVQKDVTSRNAEFTYGHQHANHEHEKMSTKTEFGTIYNHAGCIDGQGHPRLGLTRHGHAGCGQVTEGFAREALYIA